MKKTLKISLGLVSFFAFFGLIATSNITYAETATREGLLQRVLEKTGSRAALGNGVVKSKEAVSFVFTSRDGKDYTILIDSNTKFRRHFWGAGSYADVQVGHNVNIAGKWTDDTKTKIQAVQVRDLSIQKRRGIFFGTVSSVTGNGWVMATVNRGNQTVTVTASARYINRKGENISQSDIVVGHKIRIRGAWDKVLNTVTEVNEVKDFSLPVIDR